MSHIIHIVRQFAPSKGGLEDFVANLANAQIHHGHTVEIITCDRIFTEPEKKLAPKEQINGLQITRIPFYGSHRYPIAPSVFSKIKTADLVHVHAIDFFFDAFSLGYFLHRKPLIATTHGGFFHTNDFSSLKTFWFHTLTRLSTKQYDAIVACSEADFRRFEVLAGKRLHLIENGVDIKKFAHAANLTPQKRLISLSRFSKNKRPDYLIAMMAELKQSDPHWQLDLIGSPSDWTESALRSRIAALDLEDAVHLHLNQTNAEIVNIMGKASFFVSASEFEGFGIALIEGMSAGLIPIVHPNSAFQDFSRKYGFITLTDFSNPKEAARAIEIEWANAQKNGITKRNDIMTAIQGFSWKNVAAEYENLYQSLLQKNKSL